MQRKFSFRQKLGGSFAILLSLILMHGITAWFALQQYGTLFQESHQVEQVVELTIRARMNEKNYALTGERHFAITVQEELQEAQTMVHKITEHNSVLTSSLLLDMSSSLENYIDTFSQYVIYEDQQQALHSEGDRLVEESLHSISDLRQFNESAANDIMNRMHFFLIVKNNGDSPSEKEHLSTEKAGQEIILLLERLRQESGSAKVKLSVYRISVSIDDYLQVLNKVKKLEERQRFNESQMKIAAEDIQTLAKTATQEQQNLVQQQQRLTTNVMMVIFFLSIGIALGATFYLSNRLTQPLRDLVTITSSLGQGHFQDRIEIESDDEFHNLLISINQMAENIFNLTSNMEEMVEERTKALEMEKIRFEKLFENNPEGILILDEDLYVLDANHAFTTIFGYTLPEIIHQKIHKFLLIDNQLPIDMASPRQETIRRCKNGNLIPVSVVKYSFAQLAGNTLHYIIYTDISERKETEERLNFLSFHDSLTTLKNRTYFELEMKRLQTSQETCGIIVCDVDGLKYVNDNFGHAAGDQLLKDAAQLLTSAVGKQALARVGGDEFVIFLPNSSEEETRSIVANINAKLNHINKEDVHSLKMSVGYAHRENETINMEELFSIADKMMYSIKNSRRKKST